MIWVNEFIVGLGLSGPILLVALSMFGPLVAIRGLNVAVGAIISVTGISSILYGQKAGVFGFVATCLLIPVAAFVLIELLVFRPQRHRSDDVEFGSFIAALGVSAVLTAVSNHISGANVESLDSTFLPITKLFRIGGVQISLIHIIVLGTAALVGLIWWVLLRWTSIGVVFRALGDNPYLARSIGSPIDRVALVSMAASGVITGIATFLYIISTRSMDTSSGTNLLLLPLAALIVGRSLASSPGRIWGIVATALFFGVASSLTVTAGLPAGLQNAVLFSIVFVVILVNPSDAPRGRAPARPEEIAPENADTS